MKLLPEQSSEYKQAMRFICDLGAVVLIYDIRDAIHEHDEAMEEEIAQIVTMIPNYQDAVAVQVARGGKPEAVFGAVLAIVAYEFECICPVTTGRSALSSLVETFDQHVCG